MPLFLSFTFSIVFFLIFLSFLLSLLVFFFPLLFLFYLSPPSSLIVYGCPFYIVYHCRIYPFVPQLFLAPYGHPSKTTHYPAGCPATTSTQSVLVAPLSISRQNYLSCFLPLFALVLPLWIRIKLPHHLPLWHTSSGPNQYLPLLGEMPSQQDISPKEA